jgi:hypothetical protein
VSGLMTVNVNCDPISKAMTGFPWARFALALW